jgi:ATP-binding cassette subfamily B (MDR/TAP) protein 1
MVLFSIVATNINAALRKTYLHVILKQRIAFYETVLSSGTFGLALSTHSNAIRSGLAEKFGLSLKNISTIVAAFVVALHAEWKLALVTATIIPASVLVIGITSTFDEEKERSLNEVKAEAATAAEEVFSSMRTVRALGAQEKLFSRYKLFLNRAATIAW